MYIGNARCGEVGAISTVMKDARIRLADNSMLTGTTNSSRIEPVFVGSDDCQVIEDMRSIVSNDIQAVEYGIVGSNKQLPSDADFVHVIDFHRHAKDILEP